VNWERAEDESVQFFSVTIATIGPWISQKQWVAILDTYIQPQMKKHASFFKKVWGVASPARKRSTLEAFSEQMQRYSEWYQLSEAQRLGPKRALDKWEESHQDQTGKFDISTVTKAVSEFQDIVSPKDIDFDNPSSFNQRLFL